MTTGTPHVDGTSLSFQDVGPLRLRLPKVRRKHRQAEEEAVAGVDALPILARMLLFNNGIRQTLYK